MQLFQNSTEISFAVSAWMEGRNGEVNRASDYIGAFRAIYEAVYADGLAVHFRRLGRATQAAGCLS